MAVSAASRRTSFQLHRVSALLWGRMLEEKLYALERAFKANFDPNQPRAPAGRGRESGRWTDAGGGGSGGSQTSDTRVAQARRPRGRSSDGTPAQQVRRDIAEARARAAIERVREIDPNWNPQESLTAPDSIEGQIARAEGRRKEAEARLRELNSLSLESLVDMFQQRDVDLFGDKLVSPRPQYGDRLQGWRKAVLWRELECAGATLHRRR